MAQFSEAPFGRPHLPRRRRSRQSHMLATRDRLAKNRPDRPHNDTWSIGAAPQSQTSLALPVDQYREVRQTTILTKSRRRCCVCFFLDYDGDVKNGQIAHVDGNRDNNREDNLAYLCLDHHEALDQKASQVKGLTANEVKHHRHWLYGPSARPGGDGPLSAPAPPPFPPRRR